MDAFCIHTALPAFISYYYVLFWICTRHLYIHVFLAPPAFHTQYQYAFQVRDVSEFLSAYRTNCHFVCHVILSYAYAAPYLQHLP